ncbi:MAG: hypothetical protein AAGB01_12430, partial [Cyanobacteria bacterium P01_F01_bin.42]
MAIASCRRSLFYLDANDGRFCAMPKRSNMEHQLQVLTDIDKRELDAESAEILLNSLSSRYHLVVARAAKISAKQNWYEGVPHLVKAFEKMARNGVKSDSGCIAKTEIIRAINHLNARECELFAVGIRLKQLEPIWGGKEDRAANVRVASAFALAQQGCPQAIVLIAELLADKDIEARAGAA